MWMARAVSEYRASARTWLGTLTLTPEDHARMDYEISASRQINLEQLSQDELFRERARVIGQDVTLWLKRIRKELKADVRYLLVAEAHEGEPGSKVYGRPHYHILLHEKQPGALTPNRTDVRCVTSEDGSVVRYMSDTAFVRKEWKRGFSRFVECETERSAVYLCKYVSKAMMARVRASLRYGRTDTPVGLRSGTNDKGLLDSRP